MSRSFVLELVEARLLFARAVGIDVSHYQGTINWSSVKAGGVVFAFMKSGGAEGSNDNYETDAYFPSNASGASAQGIKIAPYYFPDPSNAKYTALNQADNFYSIAGSRMGNGYLPPVIDVEDSGSTPTASALGATGLTNWVNTFCTELYAKSGVKPIIYTNSSFSQTLLLRSISQWTLWIANYNYPSTAATTANPPVGSGTTYGWPSGTWKFFQYTDAAPTTGDGDYFNGDTAAFTAYFNSLKSTVAVARSGVAISNNQPAAIDFGTVKQNATGTSVSFTVSNTGSNTLTTSNLIVPSGYTVTDPLAASIVGGASDTLTLKLDSGTIGTFAGNVAFSTNDTAATSYSFPITGKVVSNDTTPPTITAANFNDTSSTPIASFTFSENVAASLSLSDFVVSNDSAGTSANPTSFAYDASTNTATLGWSNALANGNYTASVAGAGVSDAAGNVMANSYALGFFALAGDVNHDRHVDVVDLGIISSHWQSKSATFSDGDLNYDGMVDVVDLGILSSNWQQSLPAPAQPDGLRVTGSALAANAKSTIGTVAAPAKPSTPVKAKRIATIKPIRAIVSI